MNMIAIRRVALLLAVLGVSACSQSGPPAAAPGQALGPVTAPAGEAAPAAAEPKADRSVQEVGAASADTPVNGDWLLVRMPVEMPHLNPLTNRDGYGQRVIEYIFEGMLDLDPETMEMKPALAERWEESPDHLIYTFYLRKDVTFSDGRPLTAQDVKFTFDKLMDPAVDAGPKRNYFSGVQSCEQLDEYTLRFTCSKPFWQHLIYLGQLPIMPKHIYETGDFNKHPNARNPIGTGPYVLEKWDAGQQVVLARNPTYWGKTEGTKTYIDKWVFKVITDENAALQELMSGGLDAIAMQPSQWVTRAAEPDFEARFNKQTWYAPFYSYIGWNARLPIFADKHVRQALTMLLDRETIRTTVYEGLAQTVTAGCMPGTDSCNPDIKPWPFDPAAAAKLLEEAGWKDSDGDGLRDKGGKPFRFEMLIVADSKEGENTATVYKEELARTGIELNIRSLEWASLIERVHKHNVESFMLGWSMDPFPDEYQLWHSSQIDEGSNYVAFNNAEADELVTKVRETFDAAERDKMFHRFQEILHEEQPYTFLFSPAALLAVDKRVHNTVIYPLLLTRPRFEWFVPAELQKYGK